MCCLNQPSFHPQIRWVIYGGGKLVEGIPIDWSSSSGCKSQYVLKWAAWWRSALSKCFVSNLSVSKSQCAPVRSIRHSCLDHLIVNWKVNKHTFWCVNLATPLFQWHLRSLFSSVFNVLKTTKGSFLNVRLTNVLNRVIFFFFITQVHACILLRFVENKIQKFAKCAKLMELSLLPFIHFSRSKSQKACLQAHHFSPLCCFNVNQTSILTHSYPGLCQRPHCGLRRPLSRFPKDSDLFSTIFCLTGQTLCGFDLEMWSRCRSLKDLLSPFTDMKMSDKNRPGQTCRIDLRF